MSDARQPFDLPMLLETSAEAVFVCDAEGRLVALNASAARLSGLSPEAVLGMNLHAVLPGDTPAALLDRRHSEARFRLMAENLTEMVLAFDMERRLTFANSAVESLTGYSIADMERAQFINWIHPEDRERMLDHWDQLFKGRRIQEEEYRLITKDGRIKWVAATWGPIVDDRGRQVGVQGREREVTGRRMAEETLRQSEQRHRLNEERYRALFEDSPFPLWEEDFSRVKTYLAELKASGVTDLRAYLAANRPAAEECVRRVRVLDVNRAAREFYGVQAKDALTGDLTRIFDDAAYEIFCEEMAELDATNSMYKTEFQTRTMRGEERTVSMIVSLAASPQDWKRVIVSFFDVTDRRHLEEQALQSQKLESLGRLAGGIAHDFNNLLMVISGYTELLLAEVPRPESAVRSLHEIAAAAARGSDLTKQLLAFSRKSMARPRPLSLNALIRESEDMLRRVIGEDVRLAIQLAPEDWAIVADRGQMHQVLMNLVVNGREAMPGGGVLSIATRSVAAGGGSGERVLLEVGDSGMGMDEETRRNAFEPFFTTRPAGKGTGLGLATVFGIVTQAGGQISVESQPGCGSTFRAQFPRVDAQPHSGGAGTLAADFASAGNTVLVVEDEQDVRRVTCAMLRNLGYDVQEAPGGDAALEFAAAFPKPIHVLLTDVIMPVMNGRELATRFAGIRPQSRIAFMSGYTDCIMTKDGVFDPSLPLLQKPFSSAQLAAFIRKALGC